MWWDTRQLRKPTEVMMFDLEHPNDPDIDRSIGVSCLNYGPMVGTKFMFGLENGYIVIGSRKGKTTAEKLSVKLQGHYGRVCSVDCSVLNPAVFLSVGDWRARIWAEDTREGSLVSTPYVSFRVILIYCNSMIIVRFGRARFLRYSDVAQWYKITQDVDRIQTVFIQ